MLYFRGRHVETMVGHVLDEIQVLLSAPFNRKTSSATQKVAFEKIYGETKERIEEGLEGIGKIIESMVVTKKKFDVPPKKRFCRIHFG